MQFQDLPQDQHDLVISVPTFHDRRLLEYIDIGENEQAANPADAFLYYSNDEVRMRALSDGRRGAAHDSTTPEGIRKTRLSFELHPCVFFDDDDDLLNDDSGRDGINEGNNEDVVKNANPRFAALFSLLFEGRDLEANVRTPRAA
jgi:hypothetical protein